MKVTYTQNRFEIDGVEIINPEVLGVCLDFNTNQHTINHKTLLKNGDSFSLPDNIIAENDVMCGYYNLNCTYCGTCAGDCYQPKEVYRLKLNEPLVDTGSKESIDIEAIVKSVSYNVELQSGEKLIVVDYDDALFMMQELYKKVK